MGNTQGNTQETCMGNIHMENTYTWGVYIHRRTYENLNLCLYPHSASSSFYYFTSMFDLAPFKAHAPTDVNTTAMMLT